jgi:hypothetical protein
VLLASLSRSILRYRAETNSQKQPLFTIHITSEQNCFKKNHKRGFTLCLIRKTVRSNLGIVLSKRIYVCFICVFEIGVSLCSPSWLQNSRSSCLCLPNCWITESHHHTQKRTSLVNNLPSLFLGLSYGSTFPNPPQILVTLC